MISLIWARPLLGDRAVLTLDVLPGDQLLAVAEAAVCRAGRDDVHQAHLVFVEQPFDRREVHLVARVFRPGEVEGLVGARLDQLLDGLAVLGQVEVVAGDLHRHAVFDVPVRAPKAHQLGDLVGGVEGLHILRCPIFEERIQAVDDLSVVPGVLDGIEEGLLPLCRNVLSYFRHFPPRFGSRLWRHGRGLCRTPSPGVVRHHSRHATALLQHKEEFGTTPKEGSYRRHLARGSVARR